MSDNKDFKFKNLPQAFIDGFLALKKEFNIQSSIPATPTPAPVTPAPTFTEATLEDGTKIKYEGELKVGTPISVVTEQGEIAAPNGTFKLTDGTEITVVDGKVSEVKMPETAPATPAAPAVNPAMEAQIAQMAEQIASLTDKFNALSEINAKFESQTKQIEDAKKQTIQVFELVGKLMDLPSAEPIETPASTPKTLSKKERLLEKFKN